MRFLRDAPVTEDIFVQLNDKLESGGMFKRKLPIGILNTIQSVKFDGYNWNLIFKTPGNINGWTLSITDSNITQIFTQKEFPEMFL